jgi:hypothetical protein
MNTLIAIPCVMCEETLAPDDIKAWTAPKFFERYQRISIQQAVHEGLSFRWCVRRGCQNGFLCDPNNESYTTCDVCGQVTCLSYNVAYHEGVSCKDFQDGRGELERKGSQGAMRSRNPGRRFVEYLSNAPERSAESEFKRTTAATT